MKIVLLSILLSLSASADLFIEPYGGMNFNGAWTDQGDTDTNTLDGTMYGGRFGIQKFLFTFGLDYRKGSWEIENDSNTELDYTHYAAFVGVEFPILLRVYAEYIFGGEGVDQDDNRLIGASGFILGAGYKFFPFLSLNIESGSVEYRDLEFADGTNFEDREEAATYILASISIPFTL